MEQLLWRIFEKNGNISFYLFLKTLEEREEKHFLKSAKESNQTVADQLN